MKTFASIPTLSDMAVYQQQPSIFRPRSDMRVSFMPQSVRPSMRSKLYEGKQLFLKRQYRQCAKHCTDLLPRLSELDEPLNTLYLTFYAALSYDALARSMPTNALSRHRTIELAEQYYGKAAETLERLPHHYRHEGSAEKQSAEHQDASDDESTPTSSRSPSARSSLNSNSFRSSASSVSSPDSCPSSPARHDSKDSMIPGPKTPAARLAALFPANYDPLTPISPPDLQNSQGATFSVTKVRHVERYNRHIASFTAMIENHLSDLKVLKSKSRPGSRSVSWISVAPGLQDGIKQQMEQEEKQAELLKLIRRIDIKSEGEKGERIRRGRETQWNRPRFSSEKYEEICRRALAEL